MISATYNTKNKGSFVYIVFKEDEDYVAVSLNFNLVEYGKNPQALEKSIVEASFSYLEGIRNKNLPDEYLNLTPDKKYLDILRDIEFSEELKKKAEKKVVKSETSSFFSLTNIPYHGHGMVI